MSTHNIGFYEEFTKVIFELSSNIIKYAPYFFCWIKFRIRRLSFLKHFVRLKSFHMDFQFLCYNRQFTICTLRFTEYNYLSHVTRKTALEFPTRSDLNWAVQPQEMARGLKFLIQEY